MAHSVAAQFVRTRYTLLAYLMLAYFAYLMAVLGPVIPFLTDQLRLTYTQAGAHFTAFAAGMVSAGLIGDRLTQHFGRRRLFWWGGFGMAIGALLLVVGQTPGVTIASALLMGSLGGLLLVTIQASLADAHGNLRAIAFSESNVASSFCAMLAPLLVGEFQRNGLGWRAAVFVALAALGIVVLVYSREPVVDSVKAVENRSGSGRLPALFWLLWLVIFFSVAAEWSMGYWGAEFLNKSIGLSRADASTTMTAFFGAIVAGRLIGSRLSHAIPASRILVLSGLIALIGFPLFWLSGSALVTVFGLFMVGAGLGNIFPLTLALAVGLAPDNANAASARASLGSGSAILIMPQVLGVIADRTTIQSAYGIVLVMLLLAVAAIVVAVMRTARSL